VPALRLKVAEQGRDRYGRALGRVTCGTYDANTEQVRRGMAWVVVRYAPKNSPLYVIQTEARIAHRGLWADERALPPWEWRHPKQF
jgi:endonuclease YncB( thermonuclease family)